MKCIKLLPCQTRFGDIKICVVLIAINLKPTDNETKIIESNSLRNTQALKIVNNSLYSIILTSTKVLYPIKSAKLRHLQTRCWWNIKRRKHWFNYAPRRYNIYIIRNIVTLDLPVLVLNINADNYQCRQRNLFHS